MNHLKSIFLLCTMVLVFGIDSIAQAPDESAVATNARITFSVVDKDNKSFATLLREDLRILEDGKPQQIIALDRQAAVPVTLSFLIDMSVSQKRVVPAMRTAARSFVNSVLRPGEDMGAVATFTGEVSVKQALTDNLKDVQWAVEHLEYVPSPYESGGTIVLRKLSKDELIAASTAIWDAVWFTCEETLAQSSIKSRRVIILITDGADTNSQKNVNDAIERAVKSNVVIYTIGIGDEENFGLEQAGLRKLSERTGGRALFPKKVNELETSLAQIQQELQFQYVVTYSSTSKKPSDTLRKVEIEIINSEKKKHKLKLAYPQGYFPGGS